MTLMLIMLLSFPFNVLVPSALIRDNRLYVFMYTTV